MKNIINKIAKNQTTNIIIKFFTVILMVLSISNFLKSEEYNDSRGKDFWLTYLPNYHNYYYYSQPSYKYGDSLYIFIASEVPTKGTITYYNKDNQKFIHNFQITNTKQVYIFKTSYYNFELEGYNMHGSITNDNHQCEEIAPQSFHVESDEDITVYAHSQAHTTSESFIVLPVESLGMSYFAMSYNSDGKKDVNSVSSSSTPSQFAIVATEDSTTVIIIPSTPTRVNKSTTQIVKMNKGEVYLVQADITLKNLRSDISGTDIKADKKIAVFCGHQRSTIPVASNMSNPSRDMLIEQMPPVASWGRTAFLVPYAPILNESKTTYDLYRIMAAFDSTEITIDGVLVAVLNSGEFIENILDAPHYVKSSTSMLVTQYKKTSKDYDPTLAVDGDPFMMVIPPKEQFLNFYRFINVQSYEDDGSGSYDKVYNYQYVNIVTPDSVMSSIRLDGNTINSGYFKKIGNTKYSYGNILVSDGVHEIIGKGNFGILVYGYGPANSYGYVGGMNFKPLDFEKPKIKVNDTCFKASGFIHDSLLSDSHLAYVNLDNTTLNNVNVVIDPIQVKPSIAKFNAELINKNFDGRFSVSAQDSSELLSKFTINIPGFTVAFKDISGTDSVITIKKKYRVNKENKIQLSLYNYGGFPQRIEGLTSSSKNIYNIIGLPDVLGKLRELNFEFSVTSLVDTVLYDTLSIWNDCISKKLIYLEVQFIKDKNNPQIIDIKDPCKINYDLTITDSLEWDYGIQEINILENENCDISLLKFQSDVSNMNIKIKDPYLDSYFAIEIIDSIGNRSYYSDTIPGFTITYSLDKDSLNNDYFIFGFNQLANMMCKSFKITNYGNYEITFDNAQLNQNLEFSFPQSQFPLLIKPKETKEITACFYPMKVMKEANKDTLVLFFKCLEKKIILIGNSDTLILKGQDNCNSNIKIYTTKIPYDYFVESIYPMPILNKFNIKIGIPNESIFNLSIFDSYGINRQILEKNMKLSSGIYDLTYELTSLENGIYFVKFDFGVKTEIRKIIINN